jgi:iron-sulfur cluster repair protein YtfE (RIC family)
MEIESLAAALEREHREIDEGIEAFTTEPPSGHRDRQPLTRAIRALRRHIYLEEEFLFPRLREAGLMAPVFVMLREHAQMWTTLDSLERELDADTARGTELTLCHQLTVQLLHHNMKEERILYSQADEALTASATEQLRAFLDSGELPEGWTCQKLRV